MQSEREMLFARIYPVAIATPARTRDGAVYLLRALNLAGLSPVAQHGRRHYWLWSSLVFCIAGLYFPISFLLSLLLDSTPRELMVKLPFMLNTIGIPIRMSIVFAYRQRLGNALALLDELDAHCRSQTELRTIRATIALGNRIFLIFFTLYAMHTVSNCSTCFFTQTPAFNLYNPLWDWRAGKWQFLAHLGYEFLLVASATFVELLIDSYPLIYVALLREHLKMLICRVASLGASGILGKDNQDASYMALVHCIQDHKCMLAYCNWLRPVISITIFVQFMICGSIFGLAMINFSLLLANVSTAIGTAVYVVAVLLQTFPLCYYCNCLIEDCHALSNAIFHSNWYMQNCRYRKSLLYFLKRAQTPMTFSALGVFPITLHTNITFAKFAFTVYTMANKSNLIQNLLED